MRRRSPDADVAGTRESHHFITTATRPPCHERKVTGISGLINAEDAADREISGIAEDNAFIVAGRCISVREFDERLCGRETRNARVRARTHDKQTVIGCRRPDADFTSVGDDETMLEPMTNCGAFALMERRPHGEVVPMPTLPF